MVRYEARCTVWIWSGKGSWFFATLPQDLTSPIRTMAGGPRRGFGSVKVKATIGSSTWSTSLFPDSKTGSFLLPIKAAVRKSEGFTAGDTIDLAVEIEI